MIYSDIGEKSSSAEIGEGEGTRDREREREVERDSSDVEEEVMRFSGTWWRTIGPSFGSKVA